MTNRERPKAASQAANTNRIIGIILAKVRWELRIVTAIVTNKDSIMPSKHSRDDMR